MKITLRPIDRTNYMECIELSVGEKQKYFVASNQFSLVQAAYEPDLYPLGIYNESKMVGFILYDLDEELNGWSMSRFMIDYSLQGQGFGKESLKQFLNFFTENHPDVRTLYTSAEVDNKTAILLYESAGFKKGNVFEYEFGGHKYTEVRMMLSI